MHRKSRSSLNMAKAPVSISISIERNKFVFEIEYRGDMYHEETIKYLADNLELIAAGGILKECEPCRYQADV